MSYIVKFTIIVSFYIIGAYATTDILRLLNGAHTAVWNPDCYCPICGKKIRLRDQLPMVSYWLNHGSCKWCGSKIPFSDIFLEIFIFAILSLSAVITKFSWVGFVVCVCLYQVVKLFYMVKTGRRKDGFWKNIVFSILANLIIFSLTAFLFLINRLL